MITNETKILKPDSNGMVLVCDTSRLLKRTPPIGIHSLPLELLLDIFAIYFAQIRAEEPDMRSFRISCMFYLVQVCSRWRTLPELWQNVFLRLPYSILQHGPIAPLVLLRYVDQARLWIQHARPCHKVALRVEDTRDCDDERRVRLVLLDLLIGHKWQDIHSIHLTLPTHHYQDLIPLPAYGQKTRAPHLAKVTLHSLPVWRHYALGTLFAILETNIPWVQLTHIQVPTFVVSLDNVHTIFRSAPRLEVVFFRPELREEDTPDTQVAVLPMLKLSSLKTLTLHFEGRGANLWPICRLFDTLTLPSLQDLVIILSKRFYSPNFSFESLISLHTRSKFQLNRLRLHNISPTSRTMIQFFECTPALDDLFLFACWDYSDCSEVITILEKLSYPTVLLPNLKSFCYSPSDGGDFFLWDPLADMISSRWWVDDNDEVADDDDDDSEQVDEENVENEDELLEPVTKLEHVYFYSSFVSHTSPVLKEWKEQGLKVWVFDVMEEETGERRIADYF